MPNFKSKKRNGILGVNSINSQVQKPSDPRHPNFILDENPDSKSYGKTVPIYDKEGKKRQDIAIPVGVANTSPDSPNLSWEDTLAVAQPEKTQIGKTAAKNHQQVSLANALVGPRPPATVKAAETHLQKSGYNGLAKKPLLLFFVKNPAKDGYYYEQDNLRIEVTKVKVLGQEQWHSAVYVGQKRHDQFNRTADNPARALAKTFGVKNWFFDQQRASWVSLYEMLGADKMLNFVLPFAHQKPRPSKTCHLRISQFSAGFFFWEEDKTKIGKAAKKRLNQQRDAANKAKHARRTADPTPLTPPKQAITYLPPVGTVVPQISEHDRNRKTVPIYKQEIGKEHKFVSGVKNDKNVDWQSFMDAANQRFGL